MNNKSRGELMTIKNVIDKSRHIRFVWIHNHEESKLAEIDELTEKDLSYEFKWFEITTYLSRPCIEFNL